MEFEGDRDFSARVAAPEGNDRSSNAIVVVRYRMPLDFGDGSLSVHAKLESRGLAANTINQQLTAVRRLAHEGADAGVLSPELAVGMPRRVTR